MVARRAHMSRWRTASQAPAWTLSLGGPSFQPPVEPPVEPPEGSVPEWATPKSGYPPATLPPEVEPVLGAGLADRVGKTPGATLGSFVAGDGGAMPHLVVGPSLQPSSMTKRTRSTSRPTTMSPCPASRPASPPDREPTCASAESLTSGRHLSNAHRSHRPGSIVCRGGSLVYPERPRRVHHRCVAICHLEQAVQVLFTGAGVDVEDVGDLDGKELRAQFRVFRSGIG